MVGAMLFLLTLSASMGIQYQLIHLEDTMEPKLSPVDVYWNCDAIL